MRLAEALVGTWVALAASGPALAFAQEGRDAPLPPISEARPPLPPAPETAPVPWHNHLEFGGGLAVSELPAHVDGLGTPTQIRFRPAPGFHLDLSWQVFRFLRFTGYLSEHDHGMQIPPGSLGLPMTTISAPSAHMYSFGTRVSPTLPLGKRVRLWLTAGAGWGRLEYGRFTITDSTMSTYGTRERAESFFEVPIGLGGLVEIIPRWLSFRIELTGSFVPSQIGDALAASQVINATATATMPLGPMPKLDAYFLQTFGLSLHL